MLCACTVVHIAWTVYMHTLMYFCLIVLHNNMHLMLTFNLDNHAMHFQQLLCMYKLHSYIASYRLYIQLCIFILYIYTIPSQLLCYKSCVLGHQQKSGCALAMVVYTVFTMLRALIFSVQYVIPTRDLLRRLESVSHNLYYHINITVKKLILYSIYLI